MDKTTRNLYDGHYLKTHAEGLSSDYTHRMTEELIKEVETTVREWLDNNGAEAPILELNLNSGDGEVVSHLLFSRFQSEADN